MQQPVIICGFHRSGTSMSAQALSRGGLNLGDSLLPANLANPDGYFEDIETVMLHDAWLAQNGCDWCCIDSLPSVSKAQSRKDIDPIVQRLAKAPKHWGIKDPRVTLFLSQWQSALKQPVFIMVYRHYASCVDSLRRRQAHELLKDPSTDDEAIRFWQTSDIALRSWLLHNKAMLAHLKKYPKSCLLLSQEAQICGTNVLKLANERFDLELDENVDTGVDSKKATMYKRINLPAVDAELQADLEQTWQQLQLAAVAPAPQHARVHWSINDAKDVHETLKNPNDIWDKLGVAEATAIETQDTVTTTHTAESCEEPQIRLPVSAEALFEATDLNNRPQVHAALKQLSLDDQRQFLKAALATDPNNVFFNTLMGIRLLNNGQLGESEPCLLIASKADSALVWFQLGLLKQRQDKLPEAINYFEKAVAIEAKPDRFVVLINACIKSDELEKAMEHQSVALAAFPNDIRFTSFRARILTAQGRQEDALHWCLEKDSLAAGPYLLKQASEILLDLGRGNEAQRYYKLATLREISQQNHYRQRASKVLTAIPGNQASALTQVWQTQVDGLLAADFHP